MQVKVTPILPRFATAILPLLQQCLREQHMVYHTRAAEQICAVLHALVMRTLCVFVSEEAGAAAVAKSDLFQSLVNTVTKASPHLESSSVEQLESVVR